MSDTNPIMNLQGNAPSLADVLDLFEKDIFLNFNCHHIAQIQTFNPVNQTAVVSINYQKTYYMPNDLGVYQNQLKPYPLLIDCPVICLGGGNGALTFPISPGDDCLVFYNDRDIDNWFQGSTSSAPATNRLHSFADAIILVGLRSMSNVLVNYSADAVELRTKDGLTKISLMTDGSKVSVSVGPLLSFEFGSDGTLKATNALGELFASIANLFTAIPSGTVLGVPIVLPPTYTEDLAVVESFV